MNTGGQVKEEPVTMPIETKEQPKQVNDGSARPN